MSLSTRCGSRGVILLSSCRMLCECGDKQRISPFWCHLCWLFHMGRLSHISIGRSIHGGSALPSVKQQFSSYRHMVTASTSLVFHNHIVYHSFHCILAPKMPRIQVADHQLTVYHKGLYEYWMSIVRPAVVPVLLQNVPSW